MLLQMTEKMYQIDSPPMQMEKLQGDVLQKFFNNPDIKSALMKADEAYLHWEQLKYKTWIPQNLNKETFWTLVRLYRLFGATNTPIRDSKGIFFKMNTNNYSRFLHTIDKEMAGNFMGIPDKGYNVWHINKFQ